MTLCFFSLVIISHVTSDCVLLKHTTFKVKQEIDQVLTANSLKLDLANLPYFIVVKSNIN